MKILVLFTNKNSHGTISFIYLLFESSGKICFSDKHFCWSQNTWHFGQLRHSLFWDVMQHNWIVWPEKMGQVSWPKTLSLTTNLTLHKIPDKQSPLDNNRQKYTQINGYMFQLILKPSSCQYLHIKDGEVIGTEMCFIV
jgi:hypothetical protein